MQFLIQAFSAGDRMLDRVAEYTAADAILIDSAVAGGSGQVFDWVLAERLPLDRRVILAGGLTPENVADAIAPGPSVGRRRLQRGRGPTGQKDGSKVRRFINAANEAADEDDPEGVADAIFDTVQLATPDAVYDYDDEVSPA